MKLTVERPIVLVAILCVLLSWPVSAQSQTGFCCLPPPPGMVAWWPGDGHRRDISDGVLMRLEYGATYAQGLVGQAFRFNEAIDQVSIDPNDSPQKIPDLQQFTIGAWIKHDSMSGDYQTYIGIGNEKAVLRKHSAGQLHFYMKIDGYYRHIRVYDVLQVGVFYHVAGTYDGSVLRLYLDGVEVGSLAESGTLAGGDGASLGGGPFVGLIDEAEIYNRALSASEIQDIYNAGSTGKCKLAIENWDYTLDGGQGNGNFILLKRQDGSVTVDGSWTYNYSGSDITGTITHGSATITGTSISITVPEGIASNPDAPPGYQGSGFELSVDATTDNGAMSGTYSITFDMDGWPPTISGAAEGTRTGGAGITDTSFDTDGDGMPDGWEVSYELDPTRDDASADCDRDGFTNLVEYLRGTVPNDPNFHPPRAMPWIPLLLLED